MRIKDPLTENEEPYNLIPLTDMVFNLLIFFMCATTFAQIERDVRVQLPRIAQSHPLSAPPQELMINIRENGEMYVGGQPMDEATLGKFLSEQISRDPARPVMIRADERSLHRYFAAVARICKQSGVSELKIGYLEGGRAAPAQ